MTREQLDEHIRRMVADWPPFTPGQKARLRTLLSSGARPKGQAPREAA
ncbi:hypothetical protein [Streptomyces blattellae]|nr:hypothetical protein [Streptomyces blattellae]